MSIENITGKIISEAENFAESVINDANVKSLEIINEAKSKGEALIAESSVKAGIEAENLINRKISAAELQARKMMLIAKQEAIKKSFDVALEKLKNLPEDKYIDFLIGEIKKIPNCCGEIILNERDKNNIGEKLVKDVNNIERNKVILSNKTIQSGGGFILKIGDIEINSTFETILNSIKEELTFEVANALFK